MFSWLELGIGCNSILQWPYCPRAAGLLDVFAFGDGFLANRFAIRHLRTADVGLHVVFAQHAVDDNFQVQFAHAGNQCLSGIGLGRNAERRIFLRQPLHGHAQLVLVGLGLRLDGYGNYRGGKIDVFENDLLCFVAQRVAGVDALQTHAGANIAGINVINFFALVGMHLQQAADAFARALCRSCKRSCRISTRRNKRECRSRGRRTGRT